MKNERNSLCLCGSGKKYKKCCIALEQEKKPTQLGPVFSEMYEVCDKVLEKIDAGDLHRAEKEAKNLYRLYPNDYMVNYLNGVCYIQKERYQDAIAFFEKAIQLNPNFSEAYFNLANIYRQEMKIPQSIAYFRKIIEIEGKNGRTGKLAMKELKWFEKMLQETSGLTLDKYLKQMSFSMKVSHA